MEFEQPAAGASPLVRIDGAAAFRRSAIASDEQSPSERARAGKLPLGEFAPVRSCVEATLGA
jgi:hypothetical protein